MSTSMVDELQGWQPDPYRRHEFRYVASGSPTDLVRDGSTEAIDPTPCGSTPAALSSTGRQPTIVRPGPLPIGLRQLATSSHGSFANSLLLVQDRPIRSSKPTPPAADSVTAGLDDVAAAPKVDGRPHPVDTPTPMPPAPMPAVAKLLGDSGPLYSVRAPALRVRPTPSVQSGPPGTGSPNAAFGGLDADPRLIRQKRAEVGASPSELIARALRESTFFEGEMVPPPADNPARSVSPKSAAVPRDRVDPEGAQLSPSALSSREAALDLAERRLSFGLAALAVIATLMAVVLFFAM
jgi:hypothetical protein